MVQPCPETQPAGWFSDHQVGVKRMCSVSVVTSMVGSVLKNAGCAAQHTSTRCVQHFEKTDFHTIVGRAIGSCMDVLTLGTQAKAGWHVVLAYALWSPCSTVYTPAPHYH